MITLPENISCGYCDCSEFGNASASWMRKITRFELEFYLEDGKIAYVDDKEYRIKKDHILIAVPGQIRHSLLPFKTAYLKFSVSGDIAECLADASGYFPNLHPDVIYSKIDEIIRSKECENTILMHSHILALINMVLEESKSSPTWNDRSAKAVSDAKRFIDENFSESITLNDIAKSVHLSEIYFHNLFTESTGTTPHKYLIIKRIENAKKLLRSSTLSINEIAEYSGFGSQQYLNKVFKKETGVTPLSYRKSFDGDNSL